MIYGNATPMAILLYTHVPSFVSASLCMALLSVIIVPSFVLASHRLALDVIQHSWSQRHVAWLSCASAYGLSITSSRLALMTRSDVPQ